MSILPTGVKLLPCSTVSLRSCIPAFGVDIMVFLWTSCHVSCPGTEPRRLAKLIPRYIWPRWLRMLQQPVHHRLQPGARPGQRRSSCSRRLRCSFQKEVKAAAISNYTPFTAVRLIVRGGQLLQKWTVGLCRRGCSEPRQCPLNVLARTKSRDFRFAGQR